MTWAERQMLAEIHNPNSPYFIGGPTIPQHIQNVLNGGGYRTNYFGSAAQGFLAQPNSDTVQFRSKIVERHRFNEILTFVGVTASSVLGYLLFRKIPGSATVQKKLGQALQLPFKSLKYIKDAFVWLCKGSKI